MPHARGEVLHLGRTSAVHNEHDMRVQLWHAGASALSWHASCRFRSLCTADRVSCGRDGVFAPGHCVR